MGKNKALLVKILVDADVLIHLFKAEKLTILNEIYPNRVYILDVVLSELKENRTIRNNIDSIMIFSGIKEITFPTTSNPTLFREFLALKKEILGDGERACLVYCKYHQDIVASSNTKDIKPFCEKNSVAYLTTLDILCIAIARNKLTNQEANALIQKITGNNDSHLCCSTVEEHRSRHFDPVKIQY